MQAGLGKSEAAVIAPKHSYWLLLTLYYVLHMYKKITKKIAVALRRLSQGLCY